VHHHYVTWPFPRDRHSTPNLLVRAKYKPRGKLSLFGDATHHKKSRGPTLNNLSYIQSFLATYIHTVFSADEIRSPKPSMQPITQVTEITVRILFTGERTALVFEKY